MFKSLYVANMVRTSSEDGWCMKHQENIPKKT